MNNRDEILYQIMDALDESELPIIFKGALVLFRAKSSNIIVRSTRDIDCDWIASPPENKKLEEMLNNAIKQKLPNISFKQYREYIIGKTSAGFEIYDNGTPLTTMDMSIKPETSSKTYYYGEYSFKGYDLMNIISDKISVISSKKIARRIKDMIDVYTICLGDDIEKELVMEQLRIKNRVLDDYDFFLNHKDEVEHAYNKYKTLMTKPDFDTVYDLVLKFVDGFKNDETDIMWSHLESKWINNKVQ